jgi:hypothetical protein
MLFTSVSCAEIFTATGTAPVIKGNKADARNKAIEEALRQALLQSGAKISTEQSAKNGRLTIHNIRMSSDSKIRRYNVIEQKDHGDYIEVTIKADIYNKAGVCRGKQYAKTITPILFSYDEGQADNSERQLHDFNRELTRQFHSRLMLNKEVFNTKPWIDRNYRIDLRLIEYEHSDMKEQIRHLARITDSQYLLLGSIRDLGFEDPDGNAFTQLFNNYKRNISFSVYLVNGYTGELVFAKNYSDIAEWDFDKRDNVDVRGNRFWKTEYGKKIGNMVTGAIAEISREAMCQSLNASIIRVDNGRYHINAGSSNNLNPGDRLTIELSANYYDRMRHQRLNSNQLTGEYVVQKVFPDSAVLVPGDKTKPDSNIQIGDIARTN